MTPYGGASCIALKRKLKTLVQPRSSNELPDPGHQLALPKAPATPNVFKGLRRGFQNFRHSVMSGISALTRIAGGLACCACARPATDEWESDLDDEATGSCHAKASLACVSRASIMAGNSKKALLHRIISEPAMGEQERCRNAAVASKQTVDDEFAVKAQGVAERNEQSSKPQAKHGTADAAASHYAAYGAGACGAIGRCSTAGDLSSFCADLGTYDLHDMGLQQQVVCSKASQSSNTDRVQIDVRCVVDDTPC